jgi:hypothetical protein
MVSIRLSTTVNTMTRSVVVRCLKNQNKLEHWPIKTIIIGTDCSRHCSFSRVVLHHLQATSCEFVYLCVCVFSWLSNIFCHLRELVAHCHRSIEKKDSRRSRTNLVVRKNGKYEWQSFYSSSSAYATSSDICASLSVCVCVVVVVVASRKEVKHRCSNEFDFGQCKDAE